MYDSNETLVYLYKSKVVYIQGNINYGDSEVSLLNSPFYIKLLYLGLVKQKIIILVKRLRQFLHQLISSQEKNLQTGRLLKQMFVN